MANHLVIKMIVLDQSSNETKTLDVEDYFNMLCSQLLPTSRQEMGKLHWGKNNKFQGRERPSNLQFLTECAPHISYSFSFETRLENDV